MELEVILFYSYGIFGLLLGIKSKDRVQLHVMGNPRDSGLSNIGAVLLSQSKKFRSRQPAVSGRLRLVLLAFLSKFARNGYCILAYSFAFQRERREACPG